MSSLPTTTREYRIPETRIEALKLQQANVVPPKDSEVLVEIHAVSLQYRDLMVATGTYPPGTGKNIVPGSDCAGKILAVGASVHIFKPGDRVCANFNPEHLYGEITSMEQENAGYGALVDGVLTEYRTFPADCLVKIPELLSYEEASTLPCAALTAYNCLYGPEPLKGGDIVLTQGTGGVSIFAVQIAKANGAIVIATTSSAEKAKTLQKLGADHIINYRETPNWDEEVQRITNGRGVDHIIEIGGLGTIGKSLNAVRLSGWIHLVGFLASGEGDPGILSKTLFKAVKLRGVLIGSRTLFEQMNRLINASPDQLKPVIDRMFAFEEYAEALRYLESQKHVGKIVIKVVA